MITLGPDARAWQRSAVAAHLVAFGITIVVTGPVEAGRRIRARAARLGGSSGR